VHDPETGTGAGTGNCFDLATKCADFLFSGERTVKPSGQPENSSGRKVIGRARGAA